MAITGRRDDPSANVASARRRIARTWSDGRSVGVTRDPEPRSAADAPQVATAAWEIPTPPSVSAP